MTRRAWTLAALANAALPGLSPVRVEEVIEKVGEQFRVGFVEDTEDRLWAVRVPGDAVAAAQQDESVTLLGLLATRLPFEVPQPAGFAPLRDGRRAMVYPLLAGRPVDFALLPAGAGLAATLGRAVAAVHNLPRAVFEEAGVPVYDAEDCRRRRQADVDRGAQTGLVPTGLLTRWERMLDDVSWWRFATVPVHGRLADDHVLLTFADDDSASGGVSGMTGWENAAVGDPAEDLAALVAAAPSEAARDLLTAYTGARTDPPDGHLEERAGLLSELTALTTLLTARRLGDRAHATEAIEALHALDEAVDDAGTARRLGGGSDSAIDPVPVDFDPDPAPANFYRAGQPARSDLESDESGRPDGTGESAPHDRPDGTPDGADTDDPTSRTGTPEDIGTSGDADRSPDRPLVVVEGPGVEGAAEGPGADQRSDERAREARGGPRSDAAEEDPPTPTPTPTPFDAASRSERRED